MSAGGSGAPAAGAVSSTHLLLLGLIGGLVLIYIGGLIPVIGPVIASLGAVLAIVWGADAIRRVASYGLGTGVPSIGYMSVSIGILGVLAGLKKKLANKPEIVIEMNKKALDIGFDWGADMTHVKKLEAKAAANGKYNFDSLTVGQILDTPELRAIVEKMFPQVLNHPLLETGRTFKFVDAVPYMKDMLKDEDLDNFRDAVEEIR